MEDITPGLIQAIKDEFASAYEKSDEIQKLLKKIQEGTATYEEARQYSVEVSKLIGSAYRKKISSANLPDGKMYYNIASRLLPETLDENYRLVADYAKRVQEQLNKKAGIGLRAQVAALDQDRVDGLVELATKGNQFDDVSGQLNAAIETFSQNIVDETIRKNVEFHGQSGLKPTVRRRATARCCRWCSSLAGEYEYPQVPKDVYRRHENCRCSVLYDPGDGRKQNAWSKRWA